MKYLIFTVSMAMLCAATPPIREWAHGWETTNVRATRYTNPTIGMNIGFRLTRDPNLCDSVELLDAIEREGGNVYQAGGYPGAEILVKFPEVMDVPTANTRIKRILPMLDALVLKIRRQPIKVVTRSEVPVLSEGAFSSTGLASPYDPDKPQPTIVRAEILKDGKVAITSECSIPEGGDRCTAPFLAELLNGEALSIRISMEKPRASNGLVIYAKTAK